MVEPGSTVEVCPVCREPQQPTSYGQVESAPGERGEPVPLTWSCPHDCQQTVCAEEWDRAVLALARERRAARRD
ncbi:hypothetical protein [Actinopolymorpha pittospori]